MFTFQDFAWLAFTAVMLSLVPLVWQSYRQAGEQRQAARTANAAFEADRQAEREYQQEAKRLHLLDRKWSIRWHREKVRDLRRDRRWE